MKVAGNKLCFNSLRDGQEELNEAGGRDVPNDLLYGINMSSLFTFLALMSSKCESFKNISPRLRGVVPRTQTKLE